MGKTPKGRASGQEKSRAPRKGSHNDLMRASKLYMGIGVFVVMIIMFRISYFSHDGSAQTDDFSSRRASQESIPKETIVTKQPPQETIVTKQRQAPPQREAPEQTGHRVKVWDYKINAEYPHNTKAFLQGLLYHSGKLYESTGMYGETTVREVELKTGRVLKQTAVGRQHFGEGLALWQGNLHQLTWRSSKGFRFDIGTLQKVSEFDTPYTDGWGLTHDGTHFIATDSGTDLLFMDPATMREVRRVTVTDAGRPVTMINELEFIDGEVYANVFTFDCIARINPRDGVVNGWIVLDDILKRANKWVPNQKNDNCLNGVAFNNDTGNIIVSGKRWPSVFEIVLLENDKADIARVRDLCTPKSNIFHRL